MSTIAVAVEVSHGEVGGLVTGLVRHGRRERAVAEVDRDRHLAREPAVHAPGDVEAAVAVEVAHGGGLWVLADVVADPGVEASDVAGLGRQRGRRDEDGEAARRERSGREQREGTTTWERHVVPFGGLEVGEQ